MNKGAFERAIRRAVVLAVAALFFGSTYVIGQTLKTYFFGKEKVPPAEEMVVMDSEPASAGGSRRPASLGKPHARNLDNYEAADTDFSEEEREPGFLSQFFSPGGYVAESSETHAGQFGGEGENSTTAKGSSSPALAAGGGSGAFTIPGGSAASSSASTSSSSGGASSGGNSDGGAGSNPTVNTQSQLLAIGTGGGISGVTGSGYKVSVSGGASLSAVHGTTGSGYQVWLGEGAFIH